MIDSRILFLILILVQFLLMGSMCFGPGHSVEKAIFGLGSMIFACTIYLGCCIMKGTK